MEKEKDLMGQLGGKVEGFSIVANHVNVHVYQNTSSHTERIEITHDEQKKDGSWIYRFIKVLIGLFIP